MDACKRRHKGKSLCLSFSDTSSSRSLTFFQVTNVVDFARKALDTNQHRHIVWSGSGGGVGKTISCAEILKRHYKLHQVTRLAVQRVEETWLPLVEGLEELVVRRQIPAIHIFMSLDEIDATTPGYQVSTEKTALSFQPKPKKEKPFNGKDQRSARPKPRPKVKKQKTEEES